MIRIAILDDNNEELRLISSHLHRFLEDHAGATAAVREFTSGFSLMDEVEQHGCFDIYILDIILEEQKSNGIDVGLALRENDCGGLIIFLTASPDFAVDSYLARAFHYLLKPVSYEQLADVLALAIEEVDKRCQKSAILKTGHGHRSISFTQLAYAELNHRAVHYHLTSGEIITGPTLKHSFREEVRYFLTDASFVLCGASWLLNLSHILKIEHTTVTMQNGETFTIPRTEARPLKKKWGEYWMGGSI